MGLRKVSALARVVDPRYPSNRFVLVAAASGGLLTLVLRIVSGAGEPLTWAFRAGAAMFLGWAIAREIDPDDTASAAVAAIVAGLVVFGGAPEIGAAAGCLVAARIVVRTTGMSAHPWELAGVVFFAGYLASDISGWAAAAMLGASLWIDGGHRYRPHRPSRIAAAVAIAGAAAVAAITFPADAELLPPWSETVIFGIAVAVALASATAVRESSSSGDHDREALSLHRIKASRRVAALGVGIAAVLGSVSPAAYGPLLAAVASVGLVTVWRAAFAPTAAHAGPGRTPP